MDCKILKTLHIPVTWTPPQTGWKHPSQVTRWLLWEAWALPPVPFLSSSDYDPVTFTLTFWLCAPPWPPWRHLPTGPHFLCLPPTAGHPSTQPPAWTSVPLSGGPVCAVSLFTPTCLSVVLSPACAWLVLQKVHFKWHNYFLQHDVKLPHKNILWSPGVRKLLVSLRMPYVASFLMVEILYIFSLSFLPKMSVGSYALAKKFTPRNYTDSCSFIIYAILCVCVLFFSCIHSLLF